MIHQRICLAHTPPVRTPCQRGRFYAGSWNWIRKKKTLFWRGKNREKKSLRHVAMVAKFLDDNKPKIHLKSKFALFQTSSILFSFIQFVTWILAKFSGVESEGTVSEFRFVYFRAKGAGARVYFPATYFLYFIARIARTPSLVFVNITKDKPP